ncbi:nucleotide exchange factor GrpE [Candidatus Woesearchaeota archaeon]|nr:nucleotide exchange factor GrpE [Candidatus Woesearchaeota archaeon]
MNEKKQAAKKEQKKTDELTNLLKRVQADFENYKKRTEREKYEFLKYANADFVVKLLPVIDSLEKALDNKGVKAIYSQIMDILYKQGLKRIECKNKMFDPYLHEAMMQEISDKKEGMILEELQSGFMFNSAVIRHAKVKVAKHENK